MVNNITNQKDLPNNVVVDEKPEPNSTIKTYPSILLFLLYATILGIVGFIVRGLVVQFGISQVLYKKGYLDLILENELMLGTLYYPMLVMLWGLFARKIKRVTPVYQLLGKYLLASVIVIILLLAQTLEFTVQIFDLLAFSIGCIFILVLPNRLSSVLIATLIVTIVYNVLVFVYQLLFLPAALFSIGVLANIDQLIIHVIPLWFYMIIFGKKYSTDKEDESTTKRVLSVVKNEIRILPNS